MFVDRLSDFVREVQIKSENIFVHKSLGTYFADKTKVFAQQSILSNTIRISKRIKISLQYTGEQKMYKNIMCAVHLCAWHSMK